MKTIQKIKTYRASPEEVFECLDDLSVTGMHMTESSGMMMGNKLNLEFLTAQHSGPGARHRWTGSIMGMPMDFIVEVTKWIPGKEKIWETIGDTELIIYSWYGMHLTLNRVNGGCEAKMSISYKKPKSFFGRIVFSLLGAWYAKWCVKKMLGDAEKRLKRSAEANSLVKEL